MLIEVLVLSAQTVILVFNPQLFSSLFSNVFHLFNTYPKSSLDLKDDLHEFSPVGQILVQVSSLAQSVAPQRGLVLNAGPEGFQLIQPELDGAPGLWLPPAQSSALVPPPGHVLADQNQLPLVEGMKNKGKVKYNTNTTLIGTDTRYWNL